MAGLIARDAVIKAGAVAERDDPAGSVPRMPRSSMCAVFAQRDKLTRSGFCGLIGGTELQDTPETPLRNLALRPAKPVAETQPVVEVLKVLRTEGTEYLPVFDARGSFTGLISQRSILEALMRRERELSRKTREFRQTAQDDKQRRYETARRLEQTNQAFRKLLAALARPDSLESFKQALEALAVVADAGWAQLALTDESGRVTQRVLASHPSEESFPPSFAAEQFVQQVLQEGAIVNKAGSPPATEEQPAREGTTTPTPRPRHTAFLGIPLAMDDRKFGAIYLWDKLGGRAFVDDDEVLLSSLARAISVTLAQALDHARRKRLEAELDLLAALAREVGGAGTVEQVAEVTRRHTEAYFQWDAFGLSMSRCHGKRIQSILQIDKAMDQEEPEDVAIHTPFVDVPSEGLETSTSDQVNRRVLSGEPVLINRQNLEGVIMMSPFGNTCKPSASLVYVPIPSKDRTLGVITIQSYQKNRYALADMQFMQRIALAVAPAFRRCIAEQRTRAFFALAQKLSAASTPHQAAHIIVDVAEELIGWDSCSLHFHDPETNTNTQILMVDTMNGEKVEFQVKGYTSNPGGLSRRAIKEGPILYLRPEARFDREQSEPFGDADRPSASLMYAPLKFNHTTIGVLSIQSYTVNAYDADDLELLQALADHCSGAIERIRKS